MNDFSCEYCGSENLEYVGELYDDDVHIGSVYECLECGHKNHFDDEISFEGYDEPVIYGDDDDEA